MSTKNVRYHMEAALGRAAGTIVVMAVGLALVGVGNLAIKGIRKVAKRVAPATV